MYNKTILMGRLTGAPEIKTTQSGKSVTSFTVAVDRAYVKQGEQREADFINCIAWGNQAEFIAKHFGKGAMIHIDGRLQTRTYQAKDGSNRYVTEVVVESVSFTGERRTDQPSSAPQQYQQAPQQYQQAPQQYQQAPQQSAPQQATPQQQAAPQQYQQAPQQYQQAPQQSAPQQATPQQQAAPQQYQQAPQQYQQAPQQSAPQQATPQQQAAPQQATQMGFEDVDLDLPF